jgi:geranylgeranyl pyrophosphate synthase
MRREVDAGLSDLIQNEIKAGAGEVAQEAGQVLLAGGKRLRPLLILLAHRLAGGTDDSEVMPLALAFELIHTATLVHDDINDEANERRGKPTIHARAGQAKAVIAGDWLFVQGFGLGGRYNESIVTLMARCCANIAVSEFHQLDHVLNLATTPEDYLSVKRLVLWRGYLKRTQKPLNALECNSELRSNLLMIFWIYEAMNGWANLVEPMSMKEK